MSSESLLHWQQHCQSPLRSSTAKITDLLSDYDSLKSVQCEDFLLQTKAPNTFMIIHWSQFCVSQGNISGQIELGFWGQIKALESLKASTPVLLPCWFVFVINAPVIFNYCRLSTSSSPSRKTVTDTVEVHIFVLQVWQIASYWGKSLKGFGMENRKHEWAKVIFIFTRGSSLTLYCFHHRDKAFLVTLLKVVNVHSRSRCSISSQWVQ